MFQMPHTFRIKITKNIVFRCLRPATPTFPQRSQITSSRKMHGGEMMIMMITVMMNKKKMMMLVTVMMIKTGGFRDKKCVNATRDNG